MSEPTIAASLCAAVADVFAVRSVEALRELGSRVAHLVEPDALGPVDESVCNLLDDAEVWDGPYLHELWGEADQLEHITAGVLFLLPAAVIVALAGAVGLPCPMCDTEVSVFTDQSSVPCACGGEPFA